MWREKGVTRRAFLKGAAVAAVGGPYVITSAVRAAGQPAGQSDVRRTPNDLIAVGCIGMGGRGTGVMTALMNRGLEDARVVAVCDVDKKKREAAKEHVERLYTQRLGKGFYKGCAAYNDFRELLARGDIDAVLIATPDHWHVPIAIAAAKAGKDMYVEKPLGMSVGQGRALCKAVERYGRIFQFGTQQRSDREFRLACELARNERIGKLHTIRVGSPASGEGGVEPPMPLPQDLDYDMWLGPAPWAPYTEKRCITPWWYYISDYALGFIAGWGIHHLDIAQWGNGTELTTPTEFEGEGVFPKNGLCDTAMAWRVECTYANGVKMIYADNNKEKQGVVFEGSDGWVYVKRGHIDANPKSLLRSTFGPDDIRLYQSRDHQRNFLDCVRSRKPTIAPVEVAHRSDTICQISDIAIRLGRRLRWDPQRERFIDDPEADRHLTRAMREPWHL
ncbi:hypothetical protein AMJ85_10535 [candidate division BRC1 bacterium SM23_51]|nr:MAG: hypothetical protein AMJ85_10535 [candidate division BRC1 bacterium SM23_51]